MTSIIATAPYLSDFVFTGTLKDTTPTEFTQSAIDLLSTNHPIGLAEEDKVLFAVYFRTLRTRPLQYEISTQPYSLYRVEVEGWDLIDQATCDKSLTTGVMSAQKTIERIITKRSGNTISTLSQDTFTLKDAETIQDDMVKALFQTKSFSRVLIGEETPSPESVSSEYIIHDNAKTLNNWFSWIKF